MQKQNFTTLYMVVHSIKDPYMGHPGFFWFQLWPFDNQNPMKIGLFEQKS